MNSNYSVKVFIYRRKVWLLNHVITCSTAEWYYCNLGLLEWVVWIIVPITKALKTLKCCEKREIRGAGCSWHYQCEGIRRNIVSLSLSIPIYLTPACAKNGILYSASIPRQSCCLIQEHWIVLAHPYLQLKQDYSVIYIFSN